jgi:hypothetical protein
MAAIDLQPRVFQKVCEIVHGNPARMANGKWQMADGRWQMANAEWETENQSVRRVKRCWFQRFMTASS